MAGGGGHKNRTGERRIDDSTTFARSEPAEIVNATEMVEQVRVAALLKLGQHSGSKAASIKLGLRRKQPERVSQ